MGLRYNILYLHETAQMSGAENSLFNLVKNIDKARFNPVFVCPGGGLFSDMLRRSGIKVYALNFPALRKIIGVIPTVKKLRSIMREEKTNLVHSNSIRTNIYAALSARPKGIPIIWHARNLITDEVVDLDRLFSFLADKIICNSYAISRRFLKKGKVPDKVTVIYNGVDTDIFNPRANGERIREEFNIPSESRIVGITSRFHADKGHELFFQAARLVLKEIANCRFLVVGGAVFNKDAWREKYLRNLVREYNIADKVIFTGFRHDMPEVYAAMDIFVLAAKAEPCGRVILEAMASGKPVVAAKTGGTPEIVVDGVTGILLDPLNPDIMAKAILNLLNNKELVSAMGGSGRQRAKRLFSIVQNVAQTEKEYFKILGE
ncbi:MAG: glycosyltransferase [Candidatus Omnitrophica bacterium]|nr:glycosyltransferase [Candidatus Omnitrophota bacterium]